MNLYIGNLDEKIQSYHLKEAFQEYGQVSSAKIIKDKKTGKSQGYGFIEMPDTDQARKVIETVNGATWEGKTLIVREAYK